MAEAKTKATNTTFESFLATVNDAERRADCEAVAAIMEMATGQPAVIWGSAIVGFGGYSYDAADVANVDWPVVAFASRKTDLTLYVGARSEPVAALLPKLGKHKTGGGCLYIKQLSDVDMETLAEIVVLAVQSKEMQRVE